MTARRAVLAVALIATSLGWSQDLRQEKVFALPAGVTTSFALVAPNGSYVAAICSDRRLRVWSMASGEMRRTLELPESASTAAISDDGALLAAGGSQGAVRVWSIASGETRLETRGPAAIDAIVLSPDSRMLAFAPHELAAETWDIADHKRAATLPASFSGTIALSFARDSVLIAAADSDTGVRVWEARSGRLLSTASDLLLESMAVGFAADGSVVVGGADQSISVLDSRTGKVVRTLPRQVQVVSALLVAPDGKRVAAGYFDPEHMSTTGPLRVWDVRNATLLRTIPNPGADFNGAQFLNSGKLVVTSNGKGGLVLWSVPE